MPWHNSAVPKPTSLPTPLVLSVKGTSRPDGPCPHSLRDKRSRSLRSLQNLPVQPDHTAPSLTVLPAASESSRLSGPVHCLRPLPSPPSISWQMLPCPGDTKVSEAFPGPVLVGLLPGPGPPLCPLSTHTVQGAQHMHRPRLELSCPRSCSPSAETLTLHTSWSVCVPSNASQT